MTKKSNLYIERIYSDYPIACWALDDEVSYKQLILPNFSTTGAEITNNPIDEISPAIEDNKWFFRLDFDAQVEIFSTDNLSSITLDPSKQDMVFSAYVYHTYPLIEKYEIGINVNGIDYFSEFSFNEKVGWQNIIDVFPISYMSDPTSYLFIKVYPVSGVTNLYSYINGLSLGQDCEEYVSYSSGYTNSPVIDEYGKNIENNGEYAIDSYGSVYVRPSGIPLAYGSYQSLFVIPSPTGPSISIPSSGFLHEYGKYSNYTLEMWLRLINKSTDPIRIIGPEGSSDGIYIQEGFISLYIGPYTQSYFVGKWYRPMLLHFEYSPTLAVLFINGERVISIDIDIEKVKDVFASGSGDLGIYGSEYIENMEIDSLALYPYMMPAETAKKHFVYGQGVQEFDFSNDKFLKKTVQIDFPYSGYSYNVIYPDTIKWRAGNSSNLETSSSYIKPTTYDLPQVLSQQNGKFVDSDLWLSDNHSINLSEFDIAPYVTMKPSIEYTESPIYYKTLNIIGTKIKYIFGTFKSPSLSSPNQTIMSFDNKQTGESFKVILNNNNLNYIFYDQLGTITYLNGTEQVIGDSSYFYAGIDIAEISSTFYETIGIFFSDQNKISLTIGGQAPSVFNGRIFSLNFVDGFMFQRNNDSPPTFTNGVINQTTSAPSLMGYFSNYSLVPLFSNTSMILDIATRGYWEDYLPLSMFGKNVSTPSGTQYDLDIIQFNIDAQYKKIYDSVNIPSYLVSQAILAGISPTYGDIETEYTSYNDLIANIQYIYSLIGPTTGIRTYIALQQFDQVGEKLYSDYVNTIDMPDSGVVEINTLTLSNTKYEVFDNCCIIIPKSIDFKNFYICIFLELSVKGTQTKNMVVKRCELSSLAFNDGVDTRIGTKYSIPIYPFAESIV